MYGVEDQRCYCKGILPKPQESWGIYLSIHYTPVNYRVLYCKCTPNPNHSWIITQMLWNGIHGKTWQNHVVQKSIFSCKAKKSTIHPLEHLGLGWLTLDIWTFFQITTPWYDASASARLSFLGATTCATNWIRLERRITMDHFRGQTPNQCNLQGA